ncbi:hypothetical protein EV361DRAFT_939991 [Lentinula raphanica]|nr:hypothetical protein EV361DRAFT_939991 [Lentinula raphanica]
MPGGIGIWHTMEIKIALTGPFMVLSARALAALTPLTTFALNVEHSSLILISTLSRSFLSPNHRNTKTLARINVGTLAVPSNITIKQTLV